MDAAARDIFLVGGPADDEVFSIRALQRCGVEAKMTAFRTADDLLQAIARRAESGSAFPQLLVLDAAEGGLPLVEKLRALGMTAPVILLTASSASDRAPASWKVVFVEKPITIAACAAALRQLGISPG